MLFFNCIYHIHSNNKKGVKLYGKDFKRIEKVNDVRMIEIYEIGKEHEENFEDFFCVDYKFEDVVKELENRNLRLEWQKIEEYE